MATILEFPKPRSSMARDRQGAALLASADIVIFPGVRYEYWDRGASPPTPAKPTGRPDHQ